GSPGSSLLAIGSLVPVGPVSEPRLISVKAFRFDVSPSLSRLLAHVSKDSAPVANPSKPTRGGRVNHATIKLRLVRQGGFLPAYGERQVKGVTHRNPVWLFPDIGRDP